MGKYLTNKNGEITMSFNTGAKLKGFQRQNTGQFLAKNKALLIVQSV